MNKILLFGLAVTLFSCNKKEETKAAAEAPKTEYAVFGDSISDAGAISETEMFGKYKSMKEEDTLKISFKSKINGVCQKKGCWMTLDLGNGKEAFVKFKDYAFFVPMNAANQEAVVSGKAFVSVETVEDQKHYAKDAGESQVAIDSITAPKVTYSFMADGVLISK